MTDINDIDKIEFGILSADEIRKMAVCKITRANTTVDDPSNFGTVHDERLGCVAEGNASCVTCGKKKDCWGHFGYIDLEEPILHPMYYKRIISFLRCFCKHCYRILYQSDISLNANKHHAKGERRFNAIVKQISEKRDVCPHCNSPQPKITFKTADASVEMEYKRKNEENKEEKICEKLSTREIQTIFDNISDEDVCIMGLEPSRTHPRNLVITAFPVLPICARPYVITDGRICDDDLTQKTISIIKINQKLAKYKELTTQTAKQTSRTRLAEKKESKQEKSYNDLVQSLRFHITCMFDNSKGQAKHPTDGRAIKCIKTRLASKDGQIRHNIMGKRVNFSARTVITAGPNLPIGHLGIPHFVAQTHTIPEVVTPYNIKWLTKLVEEDKANFIQPIDPETGQYRPKIKLEYARYKKRVTELLYGDIVVRGDVDLRHDENGRIIFPKRKNKGNGQIIHVEHGNIKLETGDRVIRNGELLDVVHPVRRRHILKYGDIVERHLQKNDVCLFNRQPKFKLNL